MKVFDAYAKYYDLLYKNKNYKKESDYIISLIKKFKPDAKKILDFGSGTGKHDIHLSKKGFDVTGVELSPRMFEASKILLKENSGKNIKLKFQKGDIRTLRLKDKFDVIISLFHVLNYQATNKELISVFETAKKHLKKGGIFMFDYWYGPAVLSDRPVKKIKIMEDDEVRIKRYTKPLMKVNENKAEINFRTEVENKKNRFKDKFEETHIMRYLFLPELDIIGESKNLKHVHSEEWLTGKTLSDKTWYGLSVFRN